MPAANEIVKATITRVEKTTAGKVFRNKAGEFKAKFSEESDPVLVIFGKVSGDKEERKLANINLPEGRMRKSSKLYKLLKVCGIADGSTVSSNLREIVGREVVLTEDANGFERLQL